MKVEPAFASLDTNVLLLKLVAETDSSLLVSFKRVSSFAFEDIALLGNLLDRYRGLVTTPHVLAKASNFVDSAPTYRRSALVASLKQFVHRNEELYLTSKTLVDRNEFSAIGLADTGLVALSVNTVVVTTDYQLWGRIIAVGGYCINFNHARSAGLLAAER